MVTAVSEEDVHNVITETIIRHGIEVSAWEVDVPEQGMRAYAWRPRPALGSRCRAHFRRTCCGQRLRRAAILRSRGWQKSGKRSVGR